MKVKFSYHTNFLVLSLFFGMWPLYSASFDEKVLSGFFAACAEDETLCSSDTSPPTYKEGDVTRTWELSWRLYRSLCQEIKVHGKVVTGENLKELIECAKTLEKVGARKLAARVYRVLMQPSILLDYYEEYLFVGARDLVLNQKEHMKLCLHDIRQSECGLSKLIREAEAIGQFLVAEAIGQFLVNAEQIGDELKLALANLLIADSHSSSQNLKKALVILSSISTSKHLSERDKKLISENIAYVRVCLLHLDLPLREYRSDLRILIEHSDNNIREFAREELLRIQPLVWQEENAVIDDLFDDDYSA